MTKRETKIFMCECGAQIKYRDNIEDNYAISAHKATRKHIKNWVKLTIEKENKEEAEAPKQKEKERKNLYRENNKEKVKEAGKKWPDKNKDKVSQYNHNHWLKIRHKYNDPLFDGKRKEEEDAKQKEEEDADRRRKEAELDDTVVALILKMNIFFVINVECTTNFK
jgi:hypothetical protein